MQFENLARLHGGLRVITNLRQLFFLAPRRSLFPLPFRFLERVQSLPCTNATTALSNYLYGIIGV
jgi:hypothetical protein